MAERAFYLVQDDTDPRGVRLVSAKDSYGCWLSPEEAAAQSDWVDDALRAQAKKSKTEEYAAWYEKEFHAAWYEKEFPYV